MSQNIVPLPVIGVRETITNVDCRKSYACVQGVQNVNYQAQTSTSVSNSSIQHSIQVPSRNTIVDRNILVETTAVFNFTGPDSGGPLLEIGTNDALACYPLSRVTDTLQGQIDQSTFSIRLGDVLPCFQRYALKREYVNANLSLCPDMSDQFADLGDYAQFGAALNPLGLYGDNVYQCPRGSFPSLVVNSNTNTTAQVTATWTEPVFLSPFLYSGKAEPGIYGCQTITITYVMADLSRMWSHASSGNTLTTTTVNITGARCLYATYQPQPSYYLPSSNTWDYHSSVPNITSLPQTFAPRTIVNGQITPGASQVVSPQVITLNQMPDRIYVYAKKRKSTQNNTDSDVFALISNIQLQLGDSPIKLSGATPQQLHHMCARNGLDTSYYSFLNQVGSPICLSLPKDVGLPVGVAPGVTVNITLQITATIANLNPNSQQFDFVILPVIAGSLSMVNQFFTIQLGLISQQEAILASEQADHNIASDRGQMEGYGFWSDVWSGIKSFPAAAIKYAPGILSTIKTGQEIKKQLGYGVEGEGIVYGGGRSGGKRGGELLSRGELASRM